MEKINRNTISWKSSCLKEREEHGVTKANLETVSTSLIEAKKEIYHLRELNELKDKLIALMQNPKQNAMLSETAPGIAPYAPTLINIGGQNESENGDSIISEPDEDEDDGRLPF